MLQQEGKSRQALEASTYVESSPCSSALDTTPMTTIPSSSAAAATSTKEVALGAHSYSPSLPCSASPMREPGLGYTSTPNAPGNNGESPRLTHQQLYASPRQARGVPVAGRHGHQRSASQQDVGLLFEAGAGRGVAGEEEGGDGSIPLVLRSRTCPANAVQIRQRTAPQQHRITHGSATGYYTATASHALLHYSHLYQFQDMSLPPVYPHRRTHSGPLDHSAASGTFGRPSNLQAEKRNAGVAPTPWDPFLRGRGAGTHSGSMVCPQSATDLYSSAATAQHGPGRVASVFPSDVFGGGRNDPEVSRMDPIERRVQRQRRREEMRAWLTERFGSGGSSSAVPSHLRDDATAIGVASAQASSHVVALDISRSAQGGGAASSFALNGSPQRGGGIPEAVSMAQGRSGLRPLSSQAQYYEQQLGWRPGQGGQDTSAPITDILPKERRGVSSEVLPTAVLESRASDPLCGGHELSRSFSPSSNGGLKTAMRRSGSTDSMASGGTVAKKQVRFCETVEVREMVEHKNHSWSGPM